jgi:hypothetical protein
VAHFGGAKNTRMKEDDVSRQRLKWVVMLDSISGLQRARSQYRTVLCSDILSLLPVCLEIVTISQGLSVRNDGRRGGPLRGPRKPGVESPNKSKRSREYGFISENDGWRVP